LTVSGPRDTRKANGDGESHVSVEECRTSRVTVEKNPELTRELGH
jgi:hypothetical protein